MDPLSTSLIISRKIKPLKLLFQSMASKIGLKFQTSLPKNILPPNDQANNVDKGGIIIFLQLFQKIHGLFKNKTSFSNFTDNKVISGRTSQKNSLVGK
jgi:hypothetical protein